MSGSPGKAMRRLAVAVQVAVVLCMGATPADASLEAQRRTAHGWDECPFISSAQRPVEGGCVLKATSRTRFTLVSPFGTIPFAYCDVRLAARVDYNGEVVVDDVGMSAAPNPCGDIRLCKVDTDVDKQPWFGRIETGARPGRFRVILDACIDTCGGWFEGKLELRLERVASRWHLITRPSQIGETGLEIDGEWVLDSPNVRFKASDDPSSDEIGS